LGASHPGVAALDDRMAALGRVGSWPEIIADLDSLTETPRYSRANSVHTA
jgi:hypothetical protein